MRSELAILTVLLLLLTLTGCASADQHAHRAIHDAIAPEYLEYIEQDDSLTDEQRELRADTVAVWELLTREE